MRALVVHEPGRYAVEDLPEPAPGPGEVLVAVAAAGICGSDLELVDGRRPAAYVRYPVVPGHEWAGRVVRTGPGVDAGLRPGDPVVAEGLRACGVCARCAEGRTNLCRADYAETGFTHQGALADRLVVPARLVHRLPAERPLEPAALLEPAACVANGLLEAGMPRPGSRLAVVGDGPLGLLAVLLLLRTVSPAELLLVGARAGRAAHGRGAGATRVVDAADRAALAELGGRFDAVVEATNQPEGAALALRLLRRGGSAVLLGISGAGRPTIDPDTLTLNQLRVQGSFAASRAAWRWVVELYAGGILDPAPLVTHWYGLEEAPAALAALATPGGDALKVLVRPER
ncbi:MAG TPA: alcohol dehydrogenase catalytic domain-containing protein [Actinomycetota bacterium]|nr:alcohol dehydrogenase catalytic domain-containing protein [Actinomycetota bacterium]